MKDNILKLRPGLIHADEENHGKALSNAHGIHPFLPFFPSRFLHPLFWDANPFPELRKRKRSTNCLIFPTKPMQMLFSWEYKQGMLFNIHWKLLYAREAYAWGSLL
jgi:hypothetical protein